MPNSRMQRSEKQRKKTKYSSDSDSEREKSRKYREKPRSKAKDRRSRDRERSSSNRNKERRKRYSSSSSSSESSRSSTSSSRGSRSSSSSSREIASSKNSKSSTKKNFDHITKFEINDLYTEENKNKIIDGIEAETFKQETFQSKKKIVVDLKKDKILVPETLAVDPAEESLIHPNFLGNEELKVDKWCKKLHLYRSQ